MTVIILDKIRKRSELYLLKSALEQVPRIGARFSHTVAQNLRKVTTEIKDMEEAIKHSPGYAKYQVELKELNIKYCRKDDSGELVMLPKIIDGKRQQVYDVEGMGTDGSEFENEFFQLKAGYKIDISDHQDKLDKYTVYLEEQAAFELAQVDINDYPDGAAKFMDTLICMVKE